MNELTNASTWGATRDAGDVRPRVTSPAVPLADAEPDDEALIKAILGGDTDRFSPLVTRYQTRVMRFILKYEYNTHDAQDLAQETFLQAFRALPSFNHRARFSTWLLT